MSYRDLIISLGMRGTDEKRNGDRTDGRRTDATDRTKQQLTMIHVK